MCRPVSRAFAVGVLLSAVTAGAQPATDPQPPRRVRLVFDEQRASDRLRSQVYGLVADSVPVSEWPTVKLEAPTPISSVLRQYYAISTAGEGAAPRTHRMLADMVASANALASAAAPAATILSPGDVTLPPVPARAFSRYELGVVSRRFDPASLTYELTSPAGTDVRRGDVLQPVAADPTVRRGRLTEVVLTLTPEVANGLRSLQGDTTQPVLALDDDAEGMATVTLWGAAQEDADCESVAAWLSTSPYAARMREALAVVSRDQLARAAQNLPLTIVDWNTSVAGGHGAFVREVTRQVLAELGFDALDASVETIDLNPARNRAGLASALSRYKQQVASAQGDLAEAFAPAERWVESFVPPDEHSPQQRVPSLVLQAIFWDAFRRPRAVNFSFTTDSVALTVLDPHFVRSAAFASFAAGNDRAEASVLRQPQAEAHRWANVVNVTYGSRAGVILGSVSNVGQKVIVSVVAPGCGFAAPAGMTMPPGSSFASPYVATLAWLRMLQGTPATLLKRALIDASIPLASVGTRVESGGVFDPALFLLQPTSHLLAADGTVVPLSSLAFTMTVEAEGLSITLDASTPGRQPATVAFSQCTGAPGVCAVVRTWRQSGDVLLLAGPVRLVSVSGVSGTTHVDADLDTLLSRVRRLTF